MNYGSRGLKTMGRNIITSPLRGIEHVALLTGRGMNIRALVSVTLLHGERYVCRLT
jgi:hypothetical protein